MAKTLQFRRGTTAELSSVTGAVGELFVDTQKNTLLVHDGTTGHELVAQDGDATLNSALIGDVSIVGNTVSGVDSYGNPDSLVVDGGLQVTTGSVTQGNITTTANVSGYVDPGYLDLYPQNGFSTSAIQAILALTAGSAVTFYNVNVSGEGTYASVQFVVNFTVPVGGNGVRINVLGPVTAVGLYGGSFTIPTNGQPFLATSYAYPGIVDTTVTTLDVTGTGVAVTGTLTVNGQAITAGGGTSYDQSLNTTDDVTFNDVTFNSALVGDVSIVGNTVSGVDSYGNADTLIVDGSLTVQYDTQVTTSGSLVSFNSAGFSPTVYGSGIFGISTNSGWLNSELNTLDAIQPGTVVQFTNLQSSMYGPSTGSFTVVSSSQVVDYYGATQLNLEVSNITVTGGTAMWLGTSGTMSNFNLTWSSTTGSVVDVLDVTGTGVAVTGTLTANGSSVVAENNLKTVNGQSIVGSGDITISGGASYDQSLNTTDDVVFNSALVGDVSIVANTISGLDSYGNPDTLVVDGGLQVNFESTSTALSSVTINTGATVNYNGSTIVINTGDGWTQEQVSYFANMPPGNQISLTSVYSSSHGSYSGGSLIIDSVTIISPTYVILNVSYFALDGFGAVTGSSTFIQASTWSFSTNITSVTSTTPLDVTNTGVAVNGTLTVNGTAVGGLDTHGAVGSYAMLRLDANNGNITFGQTVVSTAGLFAGPLFPAGLGDPGTGFGGLADANGVAGTWRCMGNAPSNSGAVITLWYRVA